MSLDAVELVRRFLLHVLPKGFVRIHHFGFLANRARKDKLPLVRELIAAQTTAPTPEQDHKPTPQADPPRRDAPARAHAVHGSDPAEL